MHNNYKLDKRAITNIIKKYIKPIEKDKQIKLIIYYTKSKTSNLIIYIYIYIYIYRERERNM